MSTLFMRDEPDASVHSADRGLARYVPRVDERPSEPDEYRVSPIRGRRSDRGDRSSSRAAREAGSFLVCPHCNRAFPHGEGRRVAHRDIYFVLELRVTPEDPSFGSLTRAVKRSLVLWALGECGEVKVAAARLLGLKYSTFWEMTKRLGVEEIGRAHV